MNYVRIASACLISFLLLSGCRHPEDMSQSVKDFEQSSAGKSGTSLYLYPGTIKMFNPDNDSSFNAFVKDIKKLKIVTYKSEKDTIKPDQVRKLINSIRKESFTELMQMKQNNQEISIFLQKENNKPREFLGIIYSENSLMIADLLGTIPMSSLPSLLSGNLKMTGFTSFLNNRTQKKSNPKHEKRPSDK